MTKRKSISKSLRFEVFKRDSFTCQYCGKNPPSAILEIDHISPVKNGGSNDIDNLITSCFDCNRGKGANSLKEIPPSITDKSKIIAEKEEQIREYKKLIARKKKRENAEILSIEQIFSDIGSLNEADRHTIRTQFLSRLMPDDIESAMRLAVCKFRYSPSRAWKYFCGICWNRIREA